MVTNKQTNKQAGLWHNPTLFGMEIEITFDLALRCNFQVVRIRTSIHYTSFSQNRKFNFRLLAILRRDLITAL